MPGVRLLLMAWWAAAWLHGAIDPRSDLMICWPKADERALERIARAGVRAVIAPLPGSERFARACQRRGMVPLAYLGQAESAAEMRTRAARARSAGFRGIALDAAGALGSEAGLGAFLAEWRDLEQVVFLGPEQLGWKAGSAHVALRYGVWPGVRGGNMHVSSASREPWIDSNAWVVAWLRAMFPARAALLGYRPDEAAGVSKDASVDYATVSLALVDALAAGGNVVLAIPDGFAEALAGGRERAVRAWEAVERTSRFLRERRERLRLPASSRVALAAGTLEQSGELLNMMFRRNVSPAVLRGDAIGALDPALRVLVTANLPRPPDAARKRISAFTASGGHLFAAPAAAGETPWWLDGPARKLRVEEEREIHAYGKGQVASYGAPVADTAEFALDVIDGLGNRTRDLRVWGPQTVVGLRMARPGGGLTVALLNYGSAPQFDVLVRVEGKYRKAVCETPEESAPLALRLVRRGSGTEIGIDRIHQVALIGIE